MAGNKTVHSEGKYYLLNRLAPSGVLTAGDSNIECCIEMSIKIDENEQIEAGKRNFEKKIKTITFEWKIINFKL